ncbi:hypothetical protein ACFL6C_11455 [Myxococcota bacterium]
MPCSHGDPPCACGHGGAYRRTRHLRQLLTALAVVAAGAAVYLFVAGLNVVGTFVGLIPLSLVVWEVAYRRAGIRLSEGTIECPQCAAPTTFKTAHGWGAEPVTDQTLICPHCGHQWTIISYFG